jgi:hypothetical protein
MLNTIRAALILVLALTPPQSVLAQAAQSTDWTTDPQTGCRPQDTHHEHHNWHQLRWWGPCVDGVADGEGILEWLQIPLIGGRFLARYEGRLRNGRRDGFGL